MPAEAGERLAVHVGGEVRADGVGVLLADVLRTALFIKARHFIRQLRHFGGGEVTGEEQIAVPVELFDLLGGQDHGETSLVMMCFRDAVV